MDVSEMTTRPELVAKAATSPEDYSKDTIADPVGAAIRENSAESSRYPFWALETFEASGTNIFGKRFVGGEGLIPRRSYLDELLEIMHDSLSDENMAGMMELARNNHGTQIDAIIDTLEPLLTAKELSAECRWEVFVSPFGNMAHKYHAKRIIKKAIYAKNLRKLEEAPDSVLPDFLASQQEKMLDTSATCGMYHILAERMREINGNKPFNLSMPSIEYNLKLETQSTADWITGQNATNDKVKLVSLEALKSFKIAC
jgi:hypothetical protein